VNQRKAAPAAGSVSTPIVLYMCGVEHVAAKLLCLLADSELIMTRLSIAVSSVPLQLC
jgi:hypothetical protein